MDVQTGVDNFRRAIKHCTNLAEVHRAHGGGGVGRRYREVSINRAIIVLAAAAWQAAVQDLANAAMEAGTPGVGDSMSRETYAVVTGPARKAVGDFATPNAENSRRLLVGVGFDPRPHWRWELPGRVVWDSTNTSTRLNEWLQVRHAVAHGHDQLPHVQALSWVRSNPNSRDAPALTLPDAESCVKFMHRMVRVTSDSLTDHLGVTRPSWS